MKDKNLPDDIKNKSLNELTELANNIVKNLEKNKDFEESISEYQNLITLNLFGGIHGKRDGLGRLAESNWQDTVGQRVQCPAMANFLSIILPLQDRDGLS